MTFDVYHVSVILEPSYWFMTLDVYHVSMILGLSHT